MSVRDKVLHFYLTNDEVDENILDSVNNIVSSDLNSRKTVAIFDYFSSIVNDFMSFCPFLNQGQDEEDEGDDDDDDDDDEQKEEQQECTHEATRRKLLDAFFVSKKQNASMFVKQYCESELMEESLAQRSLSTSAFLRPLLKLGFQLLPFHSIQKQEDDIEQTMGDINDITEKLETECKRFKDQCETFYQELDNQQERNLCKEMEDLLKTNKEEQLEQEYSESTQ